MATRRVPVAVRAWVIAPPPRPPQPTMASFSSSLPATWAQASMGRLTVAAATAAPPRNFRRLVAVPVVGVVLLSIRNAVFLRFFSGEATVLRLGGGRGK